MAASFVGMSTLAGSASIATTLLMATSSLPDAVNPTVHAAAQPSEPAASSTSTSNNIMSPSTIAPLAIGAVAGSFVLFLLLGMGVAYLFRRSMNKKREEFARQNSAWPQNRWAAPSEDEEAGLAPTYDNRSKKLGDRPAISYPDMFKVSPARSPNGHLQNLDQRNMPHNHFDTHTSAIGIAVSPEIGTTASASTPTSRRSSSDVFPTTPVILRQKPLPPEPAGQKPQRPRPESNWTLFEEDGQAQVQQRISTTPQLVSNGRFPVKPSILTADSSHPVRKSSLHVRASPRTSPRITQGRVKDQQQLSNGQSTVAAPPESPVLGTGRFSTPLAKPQLLAPLVQLPNLPQPATQSRPRKKLSIDTDLNGRKKVWQPKIHVMQGPAQGYPAMQVPAPSHDFQHTRAPDVSSHHARYLAPETTHSPSQPLSAALASARSIPQTANTVSPAPSYLPRYYLGLQTPMSPAPPSALYPAPTGSLPPPPSNLKHTPAVESLSTIRQSSSSSSTAFESLHSEDETPEEHQSLRFSATPTTPIVISLDPSCESPISGLRYPKIPRSANQTVPRSPPFHSGAHVQSVSSQRSTLVSHRKQASSERVGVKLPPSSYHQRSSSRGRGLNIQNASTGSPQPRSVQKQDLGSAPLGLAYRNDCAQRNEMALKSPLWEPQLTPRRNTQGDMLLEVF